MPSPMPSPDVLTFILKCGGKARGELLFEDVTYGDMEGRYYVAGSTHERFFYRKQEGQLHVAF